MMPGMPADIPIQSRLSFGSVSKLSIPGFEPSRESYAYAQAVLQRAIELLRAAGLEARADVDCFIAMVAGLIDAQTSNDPGGDRWTRHLGRLTDMYLDEGERRRTRR